MSTSKNLQSVRTKIRQISQQPVTIVAVTKNRSLPEIQEIIAGGITDIGENRLQEAKEKLPQLPKSIIKHFIGHLQTNKVAEVIRLFDVIQSVDRLKLAQKIDREAEKLDKKMPILIQVNTSGESQKSGCVPEEAESLIREAAKLKHLQIQGLMTIAIHSDDKEKVRACFRKLKSLFEQIQQKKIPNVQMQTLSMGMSEDYPLAIEEGANMVRIGRKLFIKQPFGLLH